MRRAAVAGLMMVAAGCLLPELPSFEDRFRVDAGLQLPPDGGGGGGGGVDAGPVPMCGETLPLSADALMLLAVRAASCGVTEGTASPAEWPRLMLDWSRVLQRSPDYEGRPGIFVDVPRDPCGRLKCLARATDCAAVFACYAGALSTTGACVADGGTGDRCLAGRALHCDGARGPAWEEDCAAQGQACTVDSSGHAACGVSCAAPSGQCIAQDSALARCNLGVGRTYVCEGRCVAGQGSAVCAPASGGNCGGNACNGDVAVDCPTRSFGDQLDCAALTGGTCRQLPNGGPVFCAPKTGGTCQGTLGFFTSCDGTTLVVCGSGVETRVNCTALGFDACVNAGPAGTCRSNGSVTDAGVDAGSDAGTDGGLGLDLLAGNLTDLVDLEVTPSAVYALGGGAVSSCGLTGCGASAQTVVSVFASSLAVNGSTLFVTTDFRNVRSCDVSGCALTTFIDVGANSFPSGLTVANARVYWLSESGASRRVQACPLTGCTGGVPTLVYSGAELDGAALSGLAVDGSALYVAKFTGGVWRIPLAGPDQASSVGVAEVTPSNFGTGGVSVDGATLRWTEGSDNRVMACILPGCAAPAPLLTGLRAPSAVGIDGTHVYGADRGTPNGSGGWVVGTARIWRTPR